MTLIHCLFGLVLGVSSAVQATVQLEGNNGSTSTFSFAVGPTSPFIPAQNNLFYFVTGQKTGATGADDYAIAIGFFDGTLMNPATPEFTTLNGVSGSLNPLYDATIAHLALVAQFPVATRSDSNKNRLYAVQAYAQTNSKTAQSDTLNDSAGNVGGAIAGITVTQNLMATQSGTSATNYVYSLVPEDGELFGEENTNSGIGSASFEIGLMPAPGIALYDASTGDAGNQALPFTAANASVSDGTAATLAATSDDEVAIYYHPWLGVAYVAMPVEAGGDGNGARAVSLLQLSGGKVTATAIAPTTGSSDFDTKIFATGDNKTVYACRLSGMYTSTRLPYLLMIGGNDGTDSAYKKNVYALPLVNGGSTVQDIGKIANPALVDSSKRQARFFTTAATAANELYDYSSAQAVVGKGPLPVDDQLPTGFYGFGDAVCASIQEGYTGLVAPGVFSSQAIFQQNGVIANWTPWMRISGTNEEIAGFGYDQRLGQVWYANNDSSADVKHTTWRSLADDGLAGSLAAYVSQQFVSPTGNELKGGFGGVQGMASFSAGRTDGVKIFVAETSGIENADTIIYTGLGRIIFAYVGARAQSRLNFWTKPLAGNFGANVSVSTNDVFPDPGVDNQDPNASSYWTYDISGPILGSLGPIDAVDTVKFQDDDSRWIAVGGINGVAILQNSDGSGWTYGAGNYPYGLSFKQFGSWRFVKKIFSDGTYLYILTKDRLDRVTLSANFAAAAPVITTLATAQSLTGCIRGGCMDALVTGKLALVATTDGLFRSGNGVDITDSALQPIVGPRWKKVVLPEGISTMNELSFASPDNAMSGIKDGGQVYVLDSYSGYYQARLHRLFVKIENQVDDDTVTAVDDYFVAGTQFGIPNIPSYFANFGGFRDHWYTDGSIDFNSRPLNAPTPPLELTVPEQVNASELLPDTAQDLPRTTPMGGLLLPGDYRFGVPLGVDGSINVINQKQSFYSRIVRSAGSGAVFVGGDFGLFVNE